MLRKKLQWNLKAQLLITMVALVLLSTLSLGFAINQKMKSSLTDNFYKSTRKEITQVNGAMNVYFNSVNESVQYFATHPIMKQIDSNITSYMNTTGKDGNIQMTPSQNGGIESEIYKFYENFTKSHPDIAYIYMGTKDGGYIQWPEGTSKEKFDPRPREWYTKAMASPDKVVRTSAYEAFTTKVPIISSATTIKDSSGNVVAVQGVDVSLKTLTDTVNNIKVGKTGYVILTDQNGMILANPKNPETNFKNLKDLQIKQFEHVDQLTDKNLNITMNNKEYAASVYVSPETQWKYIAIIDKAEITAETAEIQKIILIVLAMIAAIAILASLVVAKAMIKPLNAAVSYLHAIGSGNLTTEIPESMLNKRSEVGTILRAIHVMQKEIQNLISGISKSAHVVSQSTAQLADSMEQTRQASSQITESIIQLSSASHDEASTIVHGSEKVEELAEAIDQVTLSTKEITDISYGTGDLNQRGILIVQELVGRFNSTLKSSEDTAQAIRTVRQSAGEISSILVTILEISKQTNLLALNAAIEASRAGEHGRGFSVVADEIRKLAEQSAQAVKNIDHIITSVNTQVGSAVQAIEVSQELFKDQETAVKETENIFNEIIASVDEQVNKTSEVTHHIQAMVEKRNELTDVFTNISAITEENAAITHDVSAAAEEQLASIEDVSSYLTKLNNLSDELENDIKRFTIRQEN